MILLDTKRYEDLEQEGLAREVINRVQRLRKKANLLPTDNVLMYYQFTKDVGEALESVIKTQNDVIVKVLKKPLYNASEKSESGEVLAEEQQEVMYSCTAIYQIYITLTQILHRSMAQRLTSSLSRTGRWHIFSSY